MEKLTVRPFYSTIRSECAIIEEFVLREGTDYGQGEYSLEEKVADVERQLERGVARIVFDPKSETCDIVAG